jgi:hypothetical protein
VDDVQVDALDPEPLEAALNLSASGSLRAGLNLVVMNT